MYGNIYLYLVDFHGKFVGKYTIQLQSSPLILVGIIRTGPQLLDSVIDTAREDVHVLPAHLFNPASWNLMEFWFMNYPGLEGWNVWNCPKFFCFWYVKMIFCVYNNIMVFVIATYMQYSVCSFFDILFIIKKSLQ